VRRDGLHEIPVPITGNGKHDEFHPLKGFGRITSYPGKSDETVLAALGWSFENNASRILDGNQVGFELGKFEHGNFMAHKSYVCCHPKCAVTRSTDCDFHLKTSYTILFFASAL
jgi:hypothetical protein